MIRDYAFLRNPFVTSEKGIIEMLSELPAYRPTLKFGWIFCKRCAFHAIEWSRVSWKSMQEGCSLLMGINEIAFTPVSWHVVRLSVNSTLLRSVCYIPGCSVRHLVCTGLFEMVVRVLITCHTQYLRGRSICIFLFRRTTLQGFVTYLTGALYVHPLWLYKHQHDNRVRSKLFVACQRWWFQWWFWFVPSVPGYLREEEEHKPYPWSNPIERNHMWLHLENEVAVVKTPTIMSNNPVF